MFIYKKIISDFVQRVVINNAFWESMWGDFGTIEKKEDPIEDYNEIIWETKIGLKNILNEISIKSELSEWEAYTEVHAIQWEKLDDVDHSVDSLLEAIDVSVTESWAWEASTEVDATQWEALDEDHTSESTSSVPSKPNSTPIIDTNWGNNHVDNGGSDSSGSTDGGGFWS